MRPIKWDRGRLSLLDQRALPEAFDYFVCESSSRVYEAIKKVGDFTFVNFSVNTKQHFSSNNRAKRNVKILPNCLKIEI